MDSLVNNHNHIPPDEGEGVREEEALSFSW